MSRCSSERKNQYVTVVKDHTLTYTQIVLAAKEMSEYDGDVSGGGGGDDGSGADADGGNDASAAAVAVAVAATTHNNNK